LAEIGLGTVSSAGYSFQVEMSYRAEQLGFTVREVPIVFNDRTKGVSKMSLGCRSNPC
jgi:dolichol-phosphate mannosyltransferase